MNNASTAILPGANHRTWVLYPVRKPADEPVKLAFDQYCRSQRLVRASDARPVVEVRQWLPSREDDDAPRHQVFITQYGSVQTYRRDETGSHPAAIGHRHSARQYGASFLWHADNNAGRPYSRLSIAESLKRSPESSEFRALITSSSSYGLTEGGYSAVQLRLTRLGQSVVMPQTDDERRQGLVKAAQNIELFQRLYSHYDQHKLPSSDNFKNTLICQFNVEATLAEECIDHFRSDGVFSGLIRNFAGGERIDLQGARSHTVTTPSFEVESTITADDRAQEHTAPSVLPASIEVAVAPAQPRVSTQRVFITHGKNQSGISQVKELLQFGKFDPVVAEEQETPSVPVPDKVMDDMRSCFAGGIHVESEEDLLDVQGNTHHRINENVLIEIGAALALYKRNVVLLVQQGLHLPSNLQGLYRCEYAGNRLDYEATMKLLKTFSEFK